MEGDEEINIMPIPNGMHALKGLKIEELKAEEILYECEVSARDPNKVEEG